MKIAISNIAWNKEEDVPILGLLKKYSFSGIEIAPTKIWKDPTAQSIDSVKLYRKFWENEGITIVATQSLLFGHPELHIFGDESTRKNTLLYLEKMIRVSALLGAESMVFGSPKNRDKKNLKIKQALDIASEFFYKVGEIAKTYGIYFCIEPNPKEYGNNFVVTTEEAITLIGLVNHSHFRLHLDSGALTVNQENYKSAINQGFPFLKHFHISEKKLLPIGSTLLNHQQIASILKSLQYDRWVSIEMRGMHDRSNDKTVEEALKFTSVAYSQLL